MESRGMKKSTKTRRETAVQGTNDSSIVSKCSTASCGYYDEPYLHYFVSKVSRRAPLIHRGYYIRAVAFDRILKNFLSQHSGTRNQIISLGCGFDSTYFRLKSKGLLKDTSFYEVDFPDLVHRKRLLIENTEDLSVLVVKHETEPLSPHIEFSCSDYNLLGIDLTQLNTLEAALKMCGLDFEQPTLLFSECVMTYMTRRCSTELVRWAAETFEDAVFTIYEQINPNDAFGLFMQNHFHSIGSPLKCINAFPTLEAQMKRFYKNGWAWCEAMDMNQFYSDCVPSDEQRRVEKLESFDEYEELNLKYSHYFILTASTLSPTDSLITPGTLSTYCSLPQSVPDMLTISFLPEHQQAVHRFGHCTSLIKHRYAVTTGGFGETDGRHQRLAEITVTDLETSTSYHMPCCSSDIQYSRMHHCSVALSDGTVYLIGGRQSPYFMCNQMLKLTAHMHSKSTQNIANDLNEMAEPLSISKHCVQSADMTSNKPIKAPLTNNGVENSTSVNSNSGMCDSRPCVSSVNCIHSLSNSVCDMEETSTTTTTYVNGLSKLASAFSPSDVDSLSNKTMNIQVSASHVCAQLGAQKSDNCSESQTVTAQCLFDLGHLEVSAVYQKGVVAKERWRHGMAVVKLKGQEQIFLYGGKTKGRVVLEESYLFDPTTDTWEHLLCTGDSPGPLHSHSVCVHKGQVLLSGGLDHQHSPVDTVYLLNLDTRHWTRLTVDGLLYPRYSHTSHVFGDKLVLVGGVNQHFPPPGVAVVNLISGKAAEFALPIQEKSSLLMFHRHTSVPWKSDSVLIFGGGGNCFSFGTHLNHTPVIVNIGRCLQAI